MRSTANHAGAQLLSVTIVVVGHGRSSLQLPEYFVHRQIDVQRGDLVALQVVDHAVRHADVLPGRRLTGKGVVATSPKNGCPPLTTGR